MYDLLSATHYNNSAAQNMELRITDIIIQRRTAAMKKIYPVSRRAHWLTQKSENSCYFHAAAAANKNFPASDPKRVILSPPYLGNLVNFYSDIKNNIL